MTSPGRASSPPPPPALVTTTTKTPTKTPAKPSTSTSPAGSSSPPRSPSTKSPLKLPSSPLAATATANSTSNPTATAKRPSAEDLIDLERELHRLIARKSTAEAHLASLEGRLFDLETEYLGETASFGNLIGGFEGYLGLTGAGAGTSNLSGSATLRKVAQRPVSATSSTFPASLAALGRKEEALAFGYDPLMGGGAGTGDAVLKKKMAASKGIKSPVKKGSSSSGSGRKGETWTPPPMKARKK